MTSKSTRSLLPAGLMDVLPPEAAHAADLVERLLATFAAHGYDRVKPPVIEFEDSLLHGSATALAEQTFRLMDPVSQRMMGLRADITMQIARIATTRLKNAPRPVRLCYSGDVFRVRGAQLRPERQFTQIGLELIGALSAAADVEAVVLATQALRGVGIERLSVDLNVAMLVPSLCRSLGIADDDYARLRRALDSKDAAAVADAAGTHAALFSGLLAAAGPAKTAIAAIDALDLPGAARDDAARLAEVAKRVHQADPELQVTIDPVEHRGFEYHTGVGFTIFAPRVRGELGSGGRYSAGAETGGGDEPATGATLYLETILRARPAADGQARLFLPHGTAPELGRELREQGWITLAGLDDGLDAATEAARLGCSHLLDGNKPRPLSGKER